MFNLEQAIQSWKRKIRRNPVFEDGDAEELESHLRDRVESLKKGGYSEKEAFQKAAAEIGKPETIGDELYKTKTPQVDATPPWKAGAYSTTLLPNYLKTAFRIIKKNPVYSAINITGLAAGFACCMLIVIYLQYQTSFDSFHANSEQLYRLNKAVTPKTGGSELHAISSGPMGPQLKEDYPEVKELVRIRPWFSEVLLGYEKAYLKVDQFVLADSTFFDMFDFKMLEGNPETALTEPLSMVLSQEVATHFFGEENPIGKPMKGLNDLTYTVAGVVENAPKNSHIDYDVLVSWSSTGPSGLDFDWLNSWLPQSLYTYLLLNEQADPADLEAKFAGFMEKHFPERTDQYRLYLQPFNEIYLRSSAIQYDDELRSGSIANVYIFLAVAVLVLFMACINFVNLTTARSIDRGSEVGIRKVLGAQRGQLGVQYLGESLLFGFLAMIVALLLIQSGKPVLTCIGVPEQQASLVNHLELLLLLGGITMLTAVLSGIYPAVILSAFKPIETLYGKNREGWGGDRLLRKGLVTLQFSLSIILIIGTLVVYQQMNYLSEKDLGFEKEQVLVLPIGKTAISKQGKTFKDALLKHTNIMNATSSSSVPGSGFPGYGINPEGKEDNESWTSNVLMVGDDKFLDTYGMEMKSGRFFSEDYALDDSSAIVINEALAKSLGWDNPVGKELDVPGDVEKGRVIGVIKDFNTASLHKKVDPLLLFMDDRYDFLSLRVNPAELDQTLEYISQTWKSFDPAYPFEYYFLDQKFASFYLSDQKMLRVLALLTCLGIFVACLGLFGLSTFMVNRRKKEIGIRKVLGSSISNIILLISKDFLKLVGIGFLIAVPVAYWLARGWLQEFSYSMDIGVNIFLLAGAIAMLLAILAVVWQAVRAALMNPVNSLKNE